MSPILEQIDFLLVISTNLPPILHRFRDIAFDKSKIAIFATPLPCNPPRWRSSLQNIIVSDISLKTRCFWATFCSLAVLDPRVDHTMDVLLHLSLFSVILIDSSTESPVHDLMLSIQAVRGLPRLRAHGIVPCIIYFSRQFPSFLMV